MKVMVLAGGYDQIALIKELKKRGCEVILIDYFENPPAKHAADKHYQASTLDTLAVKEIAIKENIDLITTACTDQALLTVAKVSEELNLPCYISYETALNVTNKFYMKDKMINNGIPTSKYVVLNNLDISKVSQLQFPLVVKPTDCNSSKGVIRVDSINELEIALSNAIELSRTNMAIVEEFKEGNEVSIDVYIDNGKAKILAMTESEKIKNNDKFTIYQSKYPVRLTSEVELKIEYIAQRISEVFGLDNSPLLIQVITDGIEVNVLEFSARMGGGSKYKLIEVLSGVNIMSTYVERVLGSKPTINVSPQVNFANLNYCYCKPGVFDKLENFEEMKAKGLIEDYFQYKTKGMEFVKVETSSDRAAGYLVVADTIEELQQKESMVTNTIKVISNEGQDLFLREIILDNK